MDKYITTSNFIIKNNLHIGHIIPLELHNNLKDNICNIYINDIRVSITDEEKINGIIHEINWLKYNYNKIDYASNYMDKFFSITYELIKSKNAYIDKTLSVDSNLELFNEMKKGLSKNNVKLNFNDVIIYESDDIYHWKKEDEYYCFPTDDYIMILLNIIDNVDNIFISNKFNDNLLFHLMKILNTKSFNIYYFNKLKIENNYLSYNKINTLIKNKYINNFYDPRLYTISGLKDRGLSYELIRNFISNNYCKYSKMHNEKKYIFNYELFNNHINDYYKDIAKYSVILIDPIKIIIDNWNDYHNDIVKIKKYNHPTQNYGEHEIIYENIIYINSFDKNILLNNVVKLKGADCIEFKYIDENNNIHVNISYHSNKVKKAINWISNYDHKDINLFYIDNILDDENEFNNYSLLNYKGMMETYTYVFRFDTLYVDGLGYFSFNKKLNGWICIYQQKNEN